MLWDTDFHNLETGLPLLLVRALQAVPCKGARDSRLIP